MLKIQLSKNSAKINEFTRLLSTIELPPCDFVAEKFKTKLSKYEIEKIHRVNLNPCLRTTYKKPLILTQGYMQYVWDHSGRRYLDMFGGILTTSIGHCHPRLIETMAKQSTKIWHTSTLYLNEEMHEFAIKLANHFPEPLKCLFICNSGSEANDIALTMARLYTGAFDVIALRNGYHGSTLSTMPLCSIGIWKFPLPTSFGFYHTTCPDPYRGRCGGRYCRDSAIQTNRHCDCVDGDNCKATDYYIEDLQTLMDSSVPKKIAAMFAESIQGVGGVVQYPKNYIKRAYELVKQRQGLMIMDEVQTGFGRTGTNFWEFQSHGIVPDIVTMAKGIGNGFPLAAVITTAEIAQTLTIGSYFNTYGGNPLASTIGSTVLDVIDEENLQNRSLQLGTELLKKLAKIRDDYGGEIVGDVRGKGLMIGVEMMRQGKPLPKDEMDQIIEDCKDMGLIVGRGGPQGNVFRIAPPMCINENDVDFAAKVLEKSIEKYYDRQSNRK